MRKLLFATTHSGSDSIKFYDLGDGDIGVVHMDLWEDMDSSAVAEYGKYNVRVGVLNTRGFDAFEAASGIGQSVHDSLRSCGWELTGTGAVFCPFTGDVVAEAGRQAACCIAEAMWGYGAMDVHVEVSGNNLRKLVREALSAGPF